MSDQNYIELPEAESVETGPTITDTNSKAKTRQRLMGGVVFGAVVIGFGFVAWQMLKPVPNRDNPEAARRLLATADLARGDKSEAAEAEALQVRVQSLDQQLAALNNEKATWDQEKAVLAQQLEGERADALRTIDVLNNQLETRRSNPTPGPNGGMGAAAVEGAPAMPAYSASSAPGQGDPFAPLGTGAGGQRSSLASGEGAARPRRTLSTIRVSSQGNGQASDGPRVAAGGRGPNGQGAQASGQAGGQYMTGGSQVYDSARFVPPNAYARARVLVGVDAATGVTSSSDPKPVLFRLVGPAQHVGIDGRFQRTDLTGCLVNGAAFGELSSEKVYIRLQRITCPDGNGRFSVATVEGYASHLGKAGVRGNVISREGGLTGRAAIAGTLQGLGTSLQRYTDSMTRSIGVGEGGLLSQPQLDARDVAAGAAGAGVSEAASTLADYYVKRAEQYQPVIEMPTGIEVELVFLSGFERAPSRR